MITAEQIKLLNQPFPRSAVRERQQGGRGVSYAEGHYIIRKLNEIFGAGAWSYNCATREVYREQIDTPNKGKRWHVSYASTCRLSVATGHEIVDVGHGHGIDAACGQAIESAEKEAATDSLKRCAKSLGDALALALYSKGQENVTDTSDAAIDAIVAELDAAKTVADIERAREMYKAIDDASPAQDARVKAAGVAAKKRTGAA